MKVMQKMLDANEDATKELNKCDLFDFNIFNLRTATNGRELESILIFMLAKRECISKTDLDIEKMHNFIRAIQSGYKNIPYHCKTHGADLC